MSKLNQLSARPPTIILTSRVDARYLATLVQFWRGQGELPRSTSELVRLSLESFAEFLTLNNKAEFVQTHEAAFEILQNTGLMVKKINPKNVAKALISEGASMSFTQPQPVDPIHSTQTKSKPISSSNPELDLAKTRLNEALSEDLQSQVADANSRTEEFKKHILNPQKS